MHEGSSSSEDSQRFENSLLPGIIRSLLGSDLVGNGREVDVKGREISSQKLFRAN